MDKETFLNHLDSTKAIGHLLIAYLAILNPEKIDINLFFNDGTVLKYPITVTDMLRGMKTFFIDSFDKKIRYGFELNTAVNILEGPDKEKVIQLFFSMALQIPIVRAFELIRYYCRETNQLSKFENQEWYNVAYAIRNCFSHNFRIEVYGKKVKELPFTWRNIVITKEMLGKPISHADIRIGSFTDLLSEMIESAKDYE